MLCEPINPDSEDEEGDKIIGDYPVNIQKLITNIETFQFGNMCTGPGSTDENIRGNILVKLHFTYQGGLLDIFSGSKEVNEITIP